MKWPVFLYFSMSPHTKRQAILFCFCNCLFTKGVVPRGNGVEKVPLGCTELNKGTVDCTVTLLTVLCIDCISHIYIPSHQGFLFLSEAIYRVRNQHSTRYDKRGEQRKRRTEEVTYSKTNVQKYGTVEHHGEQGAKELNKRKLNIFLPMLKRT